MKDIKYNVGLGFDPTKVFCRQNIERYAKDHRNRHDVDYLKQVSKQLAKVNWHKDVDEIEYALSSELIYLEYTDGNGFGPHVAIGVEPVPSTITVESPHIITDDYAYYCFARTIQGIIDSVTNNTPRTFETVSEDPRIIKNYLKYISNHREMIGYPMYVKQFKFIN